jgi:serine protease DegQ
MRQLWLIFTQAVTVGLALLFVVGTLKPHWLGRTAAAPTVVTTTAASASPPLPGAAASGAAGPQSLAAAAQRAAPAVVSVVTNLGRSHLGRNDDDWLRFFQGQGPGGQAPQQGAGSGVIVAPEGYILTNNHVVAGAASIEVLLADGRETSARVVGTDPETDLAVLKIELDRLPVLAFGNPDTLVVGDAVLAIGNPFKLGQTVTAGIVSALNRSQELLSRYGDFIQTDAAINPGNSGGALVDTQGQLVGINTAIYSRTGGNQGIGFAIPADLARQVLEGLVRNGQVTRGWIGVDVRELTPDFAQNFKLPNAQGALVAGVLADGPAARGGLKPGDVVTQVGGQPVANTAQMLRRVAALKPGEQAQLQVQRGPQALDVTLLVGQRPRPVARRAAP